MESVIQPRRTLVPGIEIHFRGSPVGDDGLPAGDLVDIDLLVPPLNLNSIRLLKKKIEAYGTGGSEDMETLCDSVMHALNRNYAGVPRWLVEQTVDFANMQDLMLAVMDVAGMRRKGIEAGKATAAEAQTGTKSTPT